MLRRFLLTLLRRTFCVLLLICLGCSAQSTSPETSKLIERQVRAFYHLPADVDVTVGPLTPNPDFPNYDSVRLTFSKGSKKDNYDFLLSKDQKTLFRMTKMDLSKDPNAELMKKINLKDRPTRGNKDAKVVVVNYDDFQCPFCSRMHTTLFPGMLKEYGDRVLFIYKDFPLEDIHPWAVHAAVNANCLAEQNPQAYWDFADFMHSNQHDVNSQKGREAQVAKLDQITLLQGQQHNLDLARLQSCIKAQKDDAVRASMKEGESLGISATPTMFVNGEEVDGALPPEELRAVLDRALTQAGVPIPIHPAATAGTAAPAAPSAGSAPAGGPPANKN
jgi:protein-disulfide isomerase